MARILIMMGASGSGKTTVAKWMAYEWRKEHGEKKGLPKDTAMVDRCSADDFPGLYTETRKSHRHELEVTLNFRLLGDAHAMCMRNYVENMTALSKAAAVGNGDDWLIIVDNTNTTAAEISPYIAVARAYGFEPQILQVRPKHDRDLNPMTPELLAERNRHGAPLHAIKGQMERLQKLTDEWPPFWPRMLIMSASEYGSSAPPTVEGTPWHWGPWGDDGCPQSEED